MARRHTAVHEAAHAVIGRVLGQICGQATIKPNVAEAGHAITADPHATMNAWDSVGRGREPATIMRGRIIGFMAGAEAENVLCGGSAGGDGEDRYQIAMMLDTLYGDDRQTAARWEQRMRRHTRTLVRRHAATIKRVAKVLLSRRTLSGAALDALIPTSLSQAVAERDALIRQVQAEHPDLSQDDARFAVMRHLYQRRASG